MVSFKQIFAVPPDHSLVLLRHSRNSSPDAETWHHEERDTGGRLVARYESWESLAHRQSGYRKFDAAGCLLEESDSLPTVP